MAADVRLVTSRRPRAAGEERNERQLFMSELASIGVVGMAVMGSNLARNFAAHGHTVAIYNRSVEKTEKVLTEHPEAGFIAARTPEELVAALAKPRRIMMMVKAGAATDATIETFAPLLEDGDILIDGGNAFYKDTQRREIALRDQGIHFVGVGVSGGEEGALNGPSIMPGGSPHSYEFLGPLLEDISAKYHGEPCCTYIGTDGAGHFVKMVHNGIEYSDMQGIGEAFSLLRAAGLSVPEISDIFREWNTGELDSYLIEITSQVLDQVDAKTGRPLVDVIVDAAGQKGTGSWTAQIALELGVDVNAVAESVFARAVSSSPELRAALRPLLAGPDRIIAVEDRAGFVEDVRQALWASKVVAYSQGLDLIRVGAQQYGWDIDVAAVARIWRAGCIIRARLLGRISDEYAANNLTNLLQAPSLVTDMAAAQDGWRRTLGRAIAAGVPVPVFSSALAYYDSARSPRLPAFLIQGQRDFFGAHTYRRVDEEGTFHTEWSGDRTETRLD